MSRSPEIKIYSDPENLAVSLAGEFTKLMSGWLAGKEKVNIAISGGSTPVLFFRALAKLDPKVNWHNVGIFWVDERCVPPDHPESNFGVARKEFLEPLAIPADSFFRIRGENDPEEEALRYGEIIGSRVTPGESIPVLDLVFLGMGADGHTASIFPSEIALWDAKSLCTVGTHPDSGQKRVSMTGQLINAASRIAFLVTGKQKSEVVKDVITRTGNFDKYPASLVKPVNGKLYWYLDKNAAAALP